MPSPKENKSYVTAEYLKKRARDEDAVNQESYRMLHIQEGNDVLELGCGPGTATQNFSRATGPSGLLIDVDCDSKMIQQAKTASEQYPNVLQLVGDAHRLPFEAGKFDRVYAKRLFQVLSSSSAPKVFAEMERVLKPGGVLVLVDTDWTSVAVNFNDLELERRLTGFFRDYMRPNGLAGRQLLGMTQQGGFRDVDVRVMTMIIRDFAETPFGDWLIAEALKAKVATVEELANWRSELEQKTIRREFLFHVGTVLVSAKKKD
jgi:Methylase involved in ubiquinone/menaquinone biosynthesis